MKALRIALGLGIREASKVYVMPALQGRASEMEQVTVGISSGFLESMPSQLGLSSVLTLKTTSWMYFPS